jgi:RimJ/RimL family protein N-acetyltransferase
MSTMQPPDPPLGDEAVLLRPWAMSDVAEIVRCCNDPLVPRFIPAIPAPYTAADAEWYVSRNDEPDELNLAIADRDGGALLGAIGFGFKQFDPAIAEIGYWLAPEARGRGAATRALLLLSRWVLREQPVARLQLTTDIANTASQAVARRAGFTHEARLRAGMPARDGSRADCELYSLLPEEA